MLLATQGRHTRRGGGGGSLRRSFCGTGEVLRGSGAVGGVLQWQLSTRDWRCRTSRTTVYCVFMVGLMCARCKAWCRGNGKMRRILYLAAGAAILSGCQTGNPNDYLQVGYGPGFQVAHARCEYPMQPCRKGHLRLGNAELCARGGDRKRAGNIARKDQFMKNCLILHGWQRAARVKARTADHVARAQPTAPRPRPAWMSEPPHVPSGRVEISAGLNELKRRRVRKSNCGALPGAAARSWQLAPLCSCRGGLYSQWRARRS